MISQQLAGMPEHKLRDLRILCREYLEWVDSDDYIEDGLSKWKHDIYEKTMNLFYGDSASKFINKKMDEWEG